LAERSGALPSSPNGLHLQGNYFDEARLLDVAHRYQQATDWHARAPAMAEP
jgi:aspartyl-tRNA(Asn)/glutamyl-tRNA(Gln) amidotransferase subunit A